MASLTWAVILLAGLTCTQALGVQTPIQNLPSIAQIEFNLVGTWIQQCCASAITNYHLLSAASCFPANSLGRRIRIGSDQRGFGGIIREIGVVTNHPSYVPNSNDGDISVVRAASSWGFGPSIQNIPIVVQNYIVPANFDVSIAGFGVTAQGGIVGNNQLHVAAVQTTPIIDCLNQHQGRVTTNMLCVGRRGGAGLIFDPSDAGAPVIYSGHLVGVLSFGASAPNANELPAVSNAIGSYSNWILANVV